MVVALLTSTQSVVELCFGGLCEARQPHLGTCKNNAQSKA
jgi:hypothetical protein